MSSVDSTVGSIIDDIISNVVEQSSKLVDSDAEAEVDLVIRDIIPKVEVPDKSRKMEAYQGAATVAASREVVAALQAGSRWMAGAFGRSSSKRPLLRSPVLRCHHLRRQNLMWIVCVTECARLLLRRHQVHLGQHQVHHQGCRRVCKILK